MWLRAVAIWLLLAVLAVLNGGLRAALIVPRAGERWGHVLSTLILCSLILLVASATIAWIGPSSSSQAWAVGLLWLALTLAFEFLAQWLAAMPASAPAWLRTRVDAAVLEARGDFAGASSVLDAYEAAIRSLPLPSEAQRDMLLRLARRWKSELGPRGGEAR